MQRSNDYVHKEQAQSHQHLERIEHMQRELTSQLEYPCSWTVYIGWM